VRACRKNGVISYDVSDAIADVKIDKLTVETHLIEIVTKAANDCTYLEGI
jgi:hypothetical protein